MSKEAQNAFTVVLTVAVVVALGVLFIPRAVASIPDARADLTGWVDRFTFPLRNLLTRGGLGSE